MNSIRPLLIFTGKFLLIYIGLIALVQSTSLRQVYRDVYMNMAGLVADMSYQHAQITTAKLDDKNIEEDLQYTFANKLTIEKAKEEARKTGQVSTKITGFNWSYNSYRVDLMFLIFLLALVLAYQAPWQRKLLGLIIGGLIYYVITNALLYGRILYQINNNKNVFPEYQLSSFSEQFLSTATNMHTEAMFFIVLLIWGAVMIRSKDLQIFN